MIERSRFDVSVPLVDDLGIELLESVPGQVVTFLRVLPRHTNSAQVAHGGAIMTLLDVTMAMAARSTAENPLKVRTATVEMKTTFMRAGAGLLTCTGVTVHRTRSLCFCEAEIRDESGGLVARGSGTFKPFPR
ncbi:MAG: hypothetical protein RL322_177 [Pseudomonadota bacterium]|jgi:uncharacterized protein (TIGR00369 family)